MSNKRTYGKMDAVLIMKPDGSTEAHVPKMKEDENVPEYIVAICALAARLTSDPEWLDEQLEWFLSKRPQ